MAIYTYKGINPSDITLEYSKVHRQFSLHSGSNGISYVQFRSSSYSNKSLKILSNVGNHLHFLMLNYYLSGSDKSNQDGRGAKYRDYNNPYYSFGIHSTRNPQHKNKFHQMSGTGSVIYIPQKYFGEESETPDVLLVRNNTEMLNEMMVKHTSDMESVIPNKMVINPMTSFRYTNCKLACFDQWQNCEIKCPKSFTFESEQDFKEKNTFDFLISARLS